MLQNKWQAKEGHWSSCPLPAVGSSQMVSGLSEHRKQVWNLWRRWKGEAVGKNQECESCMHISQYHIVICHIHIYIYIIFNHICYIIHEYCVHQITLYFVCLFHQLSDFDPFLACIFSQPLSTSAAWLHICWGQIFVGCAAEELHISHVSARHGRDCTPSGVVLWCGMTVRWYPISVPIFQGKKGW